MYAFCPPVEPRCGSFADWSISYYCRTPLGFFLYQKLHISQMVFV